MAKGGGQGVVLGYVKYVLGFDSLAFEEGIGDAEKRMKAAQKSLGKTADKFGDMGVKLSAALTAPLVGFAAKGIAEARETQAAFAQVDAAIASMGNAAGRTREQLGDLADKLELGSLYEGDEILRKVTANMLTFGNISGETFDRAQQAVVDLATRMGTDLQSATILVGKALNDPIKGMTALGRAGIQFTETQKAQIKAFNEGGQAAKAQAIILGELERQFGGAAQAAQDVDPLNKLTDAFNQMAERVGTALLPILPVLTDALVSILDRFNSLSPETQKWVFIVAAAAAAIGPVLIGISAMVSGFSALLPLLTAMGPAFLVIRTALLTLTPLIWGAVKALAAMALTPVGAVITAIAVAVAAVYYAWKNWDKIEPILRNLYNGVKTWIMDKLNAVFDWLKGKLLAVGQWFFNLYDAVVGNSYIPDMVDEIGQHIARLQSNMVAPIQKMTGKAAEAFKQLQTDVGNIMAQLFPDETAVEATLKKFEKLDEALAAKMISPEHWAKARRRLEVELRAMRAAAANGSARDVGIWTDEQANAESATWGGQGTGGIDILPALDAAKQRSSALADTLRQVAVTGHSAFHRIAGAVSDMIYAIQDAKNASASLGDALGNAANAFGEIVGMIFGKKVGRIAGMVAHVGLQIANAFGGFRANGGEVSSGKSYIVGERGPELFTPGQRGWITPNSKMGGRDRPIVVQLMMEESANLLPTIRGVAGDVSVQTVRGVVRRQARAQNARMA
jgi:hypothetical protein